MPRGRVSIPHDVEMAETRTMPRPDSASALNGCGSGVPALPSLNNWFAWGDASSKAAAADGRITRVTHVDYRYQTVLTVFQSLTLEVYGTGDE